MGVEDVGVLFSQSPFGAPLDSLQLASGDAKRPMQPLHLAFDLGLGQINAKDVPPAPMEVYGRAPRNSRRNAQSFE
jgi:hypothetical protein